MIGTLHFWVSLLYSLSLYHFCLILMVIFHTGATDVFIAESNNYNVKKSTAKAYWTRFTLMYSKAFTKLITPVDNVYLVAFMVPSGTGYDAVRNNALHQFFIKLFLFIK